MRGLRSRRGRSGRPISCCAAAKSSRSTKRGRRPRRLPLLATRSARSGEWILGRGWHQEKWSEVPSPNVEGFPLHEALSRVSPNNPVWLTHASGHAGFANALAMKMAEVTKTTPDPAGGKILRDTDGNATGLFNERAQALVASALA